jgi:hypothetical protein
MTDPAEAKSAKPKVTSVATLKARWAKLPGNLRGGLWVLASTLFFSAMVAAIKVVGQRLHVTEILFFRQMVMIVLALPVILRGGRVRCSRPGSTSRHCGCLRRSVPC